MSPDTDDKDPPAKLTPAEREKKKREDKLADMKEQVESGRLKIRKLTDEEREAWAKKRAERGDPPAGKGRRRR